MIEARRDANGPISPVARRELASRARLIDRGNGRIEAPDIATWHELVRIAAAVEEAA
jgi:hypothetical protein